MSAKKEEELISRKYLEFQIFENKALRGARMFDMYGELRKK